MTNVIEMRQKTFRQSDLEKLRKRSESYGHKMSVGYSDEQEEYIFVEDQQGFVAHIGFIRTGGVFMDGRDLGYSEHRNINDLLKYTDRKLNEGRKNDYKFV